MAPNGNGIHVEDLVKQPTNREVYERLKLGEDAKLKPDVILAFWKYLLLCFETPRPSTDYVEPDTFSRLDKIRRALKDVAHALKADATEDKAGNLIIRREGRGSGKDKPWICLQGHLDMVVSQNEGVGHNFETDPIEVRFSSDEGIVDGWLKPLKATTLGADNGVAMAASLAMLETLQDHPPMECLFTSNEETNFHGAENLQAGELKAKRLLNLDSEDEHTIIIGSAGIFEHQYKLPVDRASSTAAMTSVSVKLMGLHGGHSGVDIHKGYGNANKLMARLFLSSGQAVSLMEFAGGSGPTAISREASCVVLVPKDSESQLCEAISQQFDMLREELGSMEPNMKLEIAVCSDKPPPPDSAVPIPPPVPGVPSLSDTFPRRQSGKRGFMMSSWECSRCERCVRMAIESGADLGKAEHVAKRARRADAEPLSVESTRKVWQFCCNMPSGVLRMSTEMEGLTESSVNFGVVTLTDDHLFCHLCVRSSSASFLESYSKTLCGLGDLVNATNVPNLCPGAPWQPRLSSALLATLKKTHAKKFDGKVPHVSATHGGLEPGTLMESHPDLDCCSIGPNVQNPHSPDERINIASAERWVNWLQLVLQELAENAA